MGDALSAKVNADWMNERVGEKVRQREHEIGVSHSCDIWVLAKIQEDCGDVEPEKGNGQ